MVDPEPYNPNEQLEFARSKLQTDIPDRLQVLLQAITRNELQLQAWHVDLLTKITSNVNRVCADLLRTIGQDEALPLVAWNARNLLELWVWIEYCGASRDNAWRFHEDALRDFLDFTKLHAKLCELTGVRNEFEAAIRQGIIEVAVERLGLTDVTPEFQRVKDAAEKVSLGGIYSGWNRLLSKFAHPTALLVVGTMHQRDRVREFQTVCTTYGLYFAGRCVLGIETILTKGPNTGGARVR